MHSKGRYFGFRALLVICCQPCHCECLYVLTKKAWVRGVQPDEGGLPHVPGESSSQGLGVGGRDRQHLLIEGQRGVDPAERQEQAVTHQGTRLPTQPGRVLCLT